MLIFDRLSNLKIEHGKRQPSQLLQALARMLPTVDKYFFGGSEEVAKLLRTISL